MMVEWLFLAVPWGCLLFVIVVFPDHTHFLFLTSIYLISCEFYYLRECFEEYVIYMITALTIIY